MYISLLKHLDLDTREFIRVDACPLTNEFVKIPYT